MTEQLINSISLSVLIRILILITDLTCLTWITWLKASTSVILDFSIRSYTPCGYVFSF